MNIGIDIDNTLTDIEKDLFDIANKYTKKINPNFKDKSPVKFDGFTTTNKIRKMLNNKNIKYNNKKILANVLFLSNDGIYLNNFS